MNNNNKISDSVKEYVLNISFYDELEDLKRYYNNEQIRKMWEDAFPKLILDDKQHIIMT